MVCAPTLSRVFATADRLTSLPALLARVLLAFTRDYGAGTRRSLTIGATVLRVLGLDWLPTRDIPTAAGISPEAAVCMAGVLGRQRLAVVSGTHRGRRADLSDRGRRTLAGHRRLAAGVETSLGDTADLRHELDAVLSSPALADAITPHDKSWRLTGPYRRRTERLITNPRLALPDHPVVLHRGAYPDGA